MSSRQSAGSGLAAEQAAEAAGDRLDRRQRVVQLVAEHADQALPGLPLLFAQRRLTSVSTSRWCGSPPCRNAPRRTSQRPAAAGERQRRDARRPRPRASRPSPSSSARAPEQPLGRPAEQPLAGAVHEPQALPLVEGEDGDVDLGHHLAQQRRRLERAEPLLAQRLGERVDLDASPRRAHRRGARRARGSRSRPRAAPTSRFASVCSGRTTRVAQRRQAADQRSPSEHDGQRPLHLGGVVAGPEQDERARASGRARPRRSASRTMRCSWVSARSGRRRVTGP